MQSSLKSMDQNEEWQPVAGYDGLYEVSNLGRVWSNISNKILTKQGGSRYRQVVLTKGGGTVEYAYVHRLVAESFIDNPENLPFVRHLNDRPKDNRVVNLAWGTAKDNTADMLRHGNQNNQRKTRCYQGHEFSEDNTAIDKKGRRICKTCRLNRGRSGLPEGDPRHGTQNGYYSRGCRCSLCFEAGRNYRESRKSDGSQH